MRRDSTSLLPRRASGGSDNGAPGLRPEYGPNYYGAFAIDPDGYRVEAAINAVV